MSLETDAFIRNSEMVSFLFFFFFWQGITSQEQEGTAFGFLLVSIVWCDHRNFNSLPLNIKCGLCHQIYQSSQVSFVFSLLLVKPRRRGDTVDQTQLY